MLSVVLAQVEADYYEELLPRHRLAYSAHPQHENAEMRVLKSYFPSWVV